MRFLSSKISRALVVGLTAIAAAATAASVPLAYDADGDLSVLKLKNAVLQEGATANEVKYMMSL